MRRPMRLAPPLVLALSLALVGQARSQCPDGSAPPCSRAVSRAPVPNSVAVLYFDNLSRDTADAFLADGLTEEIIIRLGQVRRLEVRSRFEVQRFRGRAARQDPPVLGRALNAAYLVTGSVSRVGDRVRLRVVLVRTATRAQAWGDVIDRASSDLLTVESDIARDVTTAVVGQLLPEERSRLTRPLTSDPIAYEEYLRGRQDLNRSFEEAANRSAIAHFDRAIARDSTFAAAFAAQGTAWIALADGYVPPREGYTRARDAAERALARDSTQAVAYMVLANAVLALDLDARRGEALARRAIALDPNNGDAYSSLSQDLLAQGRLGESITAAARGWEVDSLEDYPGVWYADVLRYGHRLDSAAALLPRLRAAGQTANADALAGSLLAARGDWRSARQLLTWRYYGGRMAGTLVRALVALGDTIAARSVVDSMLDARTPGYYNPLPLARAYAALGDLDRGLEWLRRAFEERTVWLCAVRVDDELAPLRADPRYAALDQQLRY